MYETPVLTRLGKLRSFAKALFALEPIAGVWVEDIPEGTDAAGASSGSPVLPVGLVAQLSADERNGRGGHGQPAARPVSNATDPWQRGTAAISPARRTATRAGASARTH